MIKILLAFELIVMPTAKKKSIPKISAEEKILHSATKLFTEKGFYAVKTRDIAQDAGINLALLNYYFRSKELLYEKVLEQNLKNFKQGIAHLFGDIQMDIYEKFGHIAHMYNEEFRNNPDLPLFILTSMSQNPKFFIDGEGMQESRMVFFEQLKDLMKKKKIKSMHFSHVMMNFMSLMLFPYLMATPIKARAGMNDVEFQHILDERVKLIPEWMKQILKP